MARTAKPTSSHFDYNVVMEDLYTAEGKKSGFKCTRRLDTGAVLSPVTKDYGIVQNSDVIEVAEEAFDKAGLTNYEREVFICRGGSTMRARYDFPQRTIKLPKVGDELGLRLDVNNSFDRTTRVSFGLGMIRLVCTNGMTSMNREFSMNRKHSNQINLDFISKALSKALTGFDNLGNADNIYTKMADKDVTQDEGLTILQNLVSGKVISEVTREGIAQIWNGPSHDEDEARTIYNLLNASTEFLTHRVGNDRFEMTNRVTENVTRHLMKATQDKKVLKNLLVPVETEAIVEITE